MDKALNEPPKIKSPEKLLADSYFTYQEKILALQLHGLTSQGSDDPDIKDAILLVRNDLEFLKSEKESSLKGNWEITGIYAEKEKNRQDKLKELRSA